MVNALEVPADMLIEALAKKLKEEYGSTVKPPKWAFYSKTGAHKEKPPENPDWWYIRAASILRKLYKSSEPIGIGAFRRIYGGRKNYGSAPEHFVEGSGSIARKILQQLEEAKLVEKVPRKGRRLSPAGRSLLDRVAKEVFQEAVKRYPGLRIYE